MLLKFSSQTANPEFKPIKIFLSYSHKDEVFKETLEEHLAILMRQGFLESWSDREISPGEEWRNKIDENLEQSKIILLLISSSFISSDYCFDIEMKRAIEKHKANEAVVIPIIIRPVSWRILPLAELQALPKDAKPITLWSNQDEAYYDVVESLRTVIVNLKNGSVSISKEMQWNWIMQLKDLDQGISKFAELILSRLQDISGDSQLSLVALVEEKNIIVLNGTKEGFHIVDELFKTNRLQEKLGFPIHSFYSAYGAGVQASAELVSEKNDDLENDYLAYSNLVYKSRRHIPALLKGLFVPRDTLLKLQFTVDSGHDNSESSVERKNSEKLIDYFLSCLATKQKDFWVNLSEYESNRMVPDVLDGTQIGRDMLAQDCLLKQLTSSLLHPDTETGRSYWQEVYRRANKLFGTTSIPVTCYHKVWMQPSSASVYSTDLPTKIDDSTANILKPYAKKKGRFAFITEAKIMVKCEEDYYAIKANMKAEELKKDNTISAERNSLYNFITPIFKDIILPEIEDEVNNGLNFSPIRQVVHSLILSKWFKEEFSDMADYNSLVNTGLPNKYRPTFKHSSLKGKSQSIINDSPEQIRPKENTIGSLNASDVLDNQKFHEIYSKLYKEGLFRVVRREVDSQTGNIMTRIYFSGKIDFTQLYLKSSTTAPNPSVHRIAITLALHGNR